MPHAQCNLRGLLRALRAAEKKLKKIEKKADRTHKKKIKAELKIFTTFDRRISKRTGNIFLL
jgi:hypothetical protein